MEKGVMEALYSKLYKKYSKLKEDKDSESDKLNHEQEIKFVKYVEAAQELIDFLKNENETLREEVHELKNEMTLIRSSKDEQDILNQKCLMEEIQKNKTLSEEIERLKSLPKIPLSSFSSDAKVQKNKQLLLTDSSNSSMSRKRSRKTIHKQANPSPMEEIEPAIEYEPANQTKNHSSPFIEPTCCKKKVDTFNCIFQKLIECVVGMKMSSVPQNEELFVSALHQSSGYSFRLSWINNSDGEDELMYNVLSLGTLERIAPEWMREVLIFSSNMCPIFFERVSRVIKLYG